MNRLKQYKDITRQQFLNKIKTFRIKLAGCYDVVLIEDSDAELVPYEDMAKTLIDIESYAYEHNNDKRVELMEIFNAN